MSKLSDLEIENLVHGKSGYEFVSSSSFPHYLLRHYLKKFKLPVIRHNMRTTAQEIDGILFVRGDNDKLVCDACGR